MFLARKIKLIVQPQTAVLLDSQSKICNWLYNHLLEVQKDDYENNSNSLKLTSGRNFRNHATKMKETHPFLKTVYSKCLSNAAIRLKESYDKFFNPGLENSFPKFKSWRRQWFSLRYDTYGAGWKLLNDRTLRLSFGKDKNGKQLTAEVSLTEPLSLRPTDKLRGKFEVVKELGVFYAIFNIERDEPLKREIKTWIALDPNHKNLVVGVDQDGKTVQFENLSCIKYWDRAIDRLQSKRDKHKKGSRKWKHLNLIVNKSYKSRREQIKLGLYTLGHRLLKEYDLILMGDYAPSLETAPQKGMRRGMLQQTVIGEARRIWSWIAHKSGKSFRVVDEKNTTKECSCCGWMEKKIPSIRVFTCVNCGVTLNRDVNSAVNISKKEGFLPSSGYEGLIEPSYSVEWRHDTGIKSRVL